MSSYTHMPKDQHRTLIILVTILILGLIAAL
jgi:hypothetical protein